MPRETIRQDFAEIDGRRLETAWIAPERSGGPTIVMLHEGLGSVSLWKDFPARLAERTGCGVLNYSRYGHGASTVLGERRPVEYMHREGEVVLPAVLGHFGIERPILFGHSDGGSIALIHAGHRPDAVAGLILEAPHVFVEDLTVASIAGVKQVYETTDLAGKLRRYHQDVDRTFWGWNDIWLDPRFKLWNIETYLPAIRCPILAIQGEDDEYGTRAQLQAIADATPATEIAMLASCGHSPHRDQATAVLDRSAAFIERLSRA
ncbi:MAG TPA: alpha/beta hydrolase [Aliidongia sp.]|uniref:alpha/beta fold hydrolase n=1 Tax=Aliidongia sp. TaxID=1914230 RepID=UPI002DDD050B|nr:alpha/beta hydrolase [Aliidongia sp.]HEV2674798.1 alpha/beta hydrolase [Aliidongia sp.]